MAAGPAVTAMEARASATSIPPGGVGHVLVTFNRPPLGTGDLRLRVQSNDETEPEQTLTLRLDVVP